MAQNIYASLNRASSFPLDSSCIHDTYSDALSYIEREKSKAYVGQIIAVVNDGNDNALYVVSKNDETGKFSLEKSANANDLAVLKQQVVDEISVTMDAIQTSLNNLWYEVGEGFNEKFAKAVADIDAINAELKELVERDISAAVSDIISQLNEINAWRIEKAAELESIASELSDAVSSINTIKVHDDGQDALISKNAEDIADLASSKQGKLVSGTNIKTINGETLIGSGDLLIDKLYSSAISLEFLSGSSTSGTMSINQLAVLQESDYNFISLNGDNYYLSDKNTAGNTLIYTHVTYSDGEVIVRFITINISALSWTLAEKSSASYQASFSDEQITATESGITSEKVAEYDAYKSRIESLESNIKGLSGAMHFIGTSTTDPSKGTVKVSGVTTFYSGDVVLYDGKEYIYDGTSWNKFGDEGSYLLVSTAESTYVPKTRTVNGYSLDSDVTLDVSDISGAIDSDDLATKQDALTADQLNAVNSGITSAAVAQIATNASNIEKKQNTLTTEQLNAVNSGVTSTVVNQVEINKDNIATKQDALVSGENIMTVNGTSLLGSGNLLIDPTATFDSNVVATVNVGVHSVNSSGQVTLEVAGMTLNEAFSYLFAEEKNPAVTKPTATIKYSGTVPTGYQEVGTIFEGAYSLTLNQGSYSYGPASTVSPTAYAVTDSRGGSADTTTGTFGTITLEDNETYYIRGTITYSDDTATPLTNLGNAATSLRITAGSVSATTTSIIAYRMCFYGYKIASAALDVSAITSDDIRSLTGKVRSISNNTLSTSLMKQIIVAFPTGKYSSVEVVNTATGAPQTMTRLATTVDVAGANGYTAVAYDVWYADNTVADTGSNTYKITVS